MEFDEVREYIPGDDIRSIDWNVTARMGLPYIKTYKEEREMTVMLLVDCSGSLHFGTGKRFKHESAAELAAILAFLAIKNNDKVGLIVFSDHVEHYIPPKKGRAHIWNIIRSVMTHEKQGQTTDISVALDFLLKIAKRKSMAFLISDFLDEKYESQLAVATRKHDLICAHLMDRFDQNLPSLGFLDIEDLETGSLNRIFLPSKKNRENIKQKSLQRKQHLNTLLNKMKAGYIPIEIGAHSGESSLVDPLMHFLRSREKKMSNSNSQASALDTSDQPIAINKDGQILDPSNLQLPGECNSTKTVYLTYPTIFVLLESTNLITCPMSMLLPVFFIGWTALRSLLPLEKS